MAEYHFDVQSVVVCGDIHGDFETLEALIRERDMHDTMAQNKGAIVHTQKKKEATHLDHFLFLIL